MHRGSDNDILPAPYALPKGVPALQHDPVRARRWFLACAVGSAALGALGTWLVVRSERAPTLGEGIRFFRWAQELAAGPEAKLRKHAPVFLHVLAEAPNDDQLQAGFLRLVRLVEQDPAITAGDSEEPLRNRLLEVLRGSAELSVRFHTELDLLAKTVPSKR